MKKMILYPGPDQVQNLIDWSLAEDLSFHKIWFKSINNVLRYHGNTQTDRLTDIHRVSQYLLNFIGGGNDLLSIKL